MPPAAANRRGFTLVELVVVAAIIALLAGILLPALAQVRAKAKAARCVSNLRQLTCALIMYASDYDDRLPKSFFTHAPDYQVATYWWALTQPYVRNWQVYACPAVPDRTVGYGFNTALNWRVQTAVANPSATILLGDNTRTASHLSRPTPGVVDPAAAGPDPRHLGLCNFSFVDGHVKPLKPESTLSPEDMWDLK
jgi:prepilin-type N-terminal cleavage/methylation domain-containing protein/prepilin-type processing-associated H-X9-DG protein